MKNGKNRIEACFDSLRATSKKGFIAYITAGDPSLKDTLAHVLLLEDAGVDLIELGIPFSDPLADGKVNQLAAARALASGTTPARVFECIEKIRHRSQIPIVCYSYLNPMCRNSFERNAKVAAQAGLDGLLLLDLPLEEAKPYSDALARFRLDHIFLVTPTSPTARIRSIVAQSTGFVYCVSREGVTGMQKRLKQDAHLLIQRIKQCTHLPVALGFGVSTPAMAKAAVAYADAVVVGSAIVHRLHEAKRSRKEIAKVAAWVRKLVTAVKEE